jgi:hypothetical protein
MQHVPSTCAHLLVQIRERRLDEGTFCPVMLGEHFRIIKRSATATGLHRSVFLLAFLRLLNRAHTWTCRWPQSH